MLKKESITPVIMGTDEWFAGRLGRFTSSEIYHLMGAKGIGEGGLSYIYRKVGEELSGLPCRREISTEATEHGNVYETENLRKFGQKKGLEFLLVQTLIKPPNSRHASTPDALIDYGESQDCTERNVHTVECKCPLSFDGYIRLWKCKTPAQVKKEYQQYYWQVLHQMFVADALVGYLSIYHPNFKAGNLNIVTFNKMEIIKSTMVGDTNDFKLLNQRCTEAFRIFEETRTEMINS